MSGFVVAHSASGGAGLDSQLLGMHGLFAHTMYVAWPFADATSVAASPPSAQVRRRAWSRASALAGSPTLMFESIAIWSWPFAGFASIESHSIEHDSAFAGRGSPMRVST